MTNEEAKRIMEFERDSMCNNCYPLIGYGGSEECDFCTHREAYESAIFALEKAEKCKWHDLRKNPEDLPENFESVLICIKGFEGKAIGVSIAIHSSFTKLWGTESYSYKDCEVIAWRKIEPFEEE